MMTVEQKLEAANKRIDELEDMVYGLHAAMRGLAHTGSEMKQYFDESIIASDRDHIEQILWAIKMCYPDD